MEKGKTKSMEGSKPKSMEESKPKSMEESKSKSMEGSKSKSMEGSKSKSMEESKPKSMEESKSKSKPKVLITRPDIPQEGIDLLQKECDLVIPKESRPITKEELLKMICGVDGLFCFLTDCIDKDVIDAAGSQLKVISTMSVGYEHIDIEYCKTKKISVSHTPDVSSDSVAEWTVTLMLCAGRNFLEAATAIKCGKWIHSWSPMWLCGGGLHHAVVGIVGMGRIGQGVMKRVLTFGVKKVLYYDVCHPIKPAEDLGAVFTEFDELLKNSDFVVCLCNLTDETKGIFNMAAFEKMKETAIFVNTSRGGVVNQKDLHDALKCNKIRGAALDVTSPEPLAKNHELLSLPNLIITPHVGSAEISVRCRMANLAAENILLGLKGEKLKTPVFAS